MDPSFGDERLPPRFWDKCLIYPGTGCWIWMASINSEGYGKFSSQSYTTVLVHRYAYERLVGPIGLDVDGKLLTLDHVVERGCIFRTCVNPIHLEPVPSAINSSKKRWTTAGLVKMIKRGREIGDIQGARNRAKTHCPDGHPYEGDNLYVTTAGKRACKTCKYNHMRRKRNKSGLA